MSFEGSIFKFGNPLVFISYSSLDRTIIDQLVDILDRYKIDVWIDHQQIKFGDSILDKISKGLEWSSAMILVISENSNGSSWCKLEYENALIKEITSGKTKIIPAIIGMPKIPIILSNKRYLEIKLNDEKKILFEKDKYDELAKTILEERTETNIASLITKKKKKVKSEQKKTLMDDMANSASLISLIISSVLNDFPVNKIASVDLIKGEYMKEIYLTVSKFIEQFELLANELISIIENHRKQGNRYAKINSINRKLSDIHNNVKTLAKSLNNLTGINGDLKNRFEKISNVCVSIADVEGESLEILVGYDTIKDNKKIPDLMDVKTMKNGGGIYYGFLGLEVKELNKMLDEIFKYKSDLLKAIGAQTASLL